MQIKIKINGDKWTVKIVDSAEMAEQRDDGQDLAGLCVSSERTIYIDDENVAYDIILHELYHAYFSYLYLDDTNSLKLLDLEEITANFFCNKSAEILKKAKDITKKLKKGME